jgi:hypothetical protein
VAGQRGETPFTGSVDGNKISFSVKRETPNGAMTMEYTGTVDGDAMKGAMHGGRFNADWTATREKAPAAE